MAYKIEEIEGIGPARGQQLQTAGIKSVEDLLKLGATAEGRKKIATTSGIEEKQILRYVNMADLFRIKGIGSEYAELLEAAGVDTVKELRNRIPENLHAKMLEVNTEKKLVRATPRLDQVQSFVEQAKKMDPIVTY